MSKSPLRFLLTGTPFPRTRRISPKEVAGGIFTVNWELSMVRIVYSPPSTASESFILRSVTKSLPSLRKTGCGLTRTFTYKSPEAPLEMASPRPVRRITSPSSIPAGIVTDISSCRRSTPCPPHALHFSFGIFLRPLQVGHSLTLVMVPRKEFLASRIRPCPLHVLQVSSSVFGSAPLPLHTSQSAVLASRIVLFVPKIDS